jgi:hypothetical protein
VKATILNEKRLDYYNLMPIPKGFPTEQAVSSRPFVAKE